MTTHEKTIEQTYQILDEIDHVRARTGIYLGSTSFHTVECYVLKNDKFIKENVTFIPAFLKVFNEILDNSIDESKRSDKMTHIKVSIDRLSGEFCVEDNGRGIPVEIHKESNQYVPEMIFTNLRSGSNFTDTDQQSLIGTNGLGSKLCAILSEYFIVETADGKKGFKQEYRNGLREKSDPHIHGSKRNYTKITFCPDYNFFKMDGLDDEHYKKIVKSVYDAAANTPNIEFTLNGKKIDIGTFEDYIKLYTDEFIYEESKDWKIGVSQSDGFDHISFVNGVDTYQAGTHVDYISNQIVSKIREFILKKHKIDVKPSDIKSHLRIFVSCNINRPRFSSQTKENMISPVSEWKTSHDVSEKFIKKLIGSSIIQSILDWVTAKQQAAELAELRKKNKDSDKTSLKKIPKFHDATTKDRASAMCFLAEGDSALSPLLGARDPQTMGLFPLKGRPINVSSVPMSKIKENAEFERIRTIIGLKYGEKADPKKLNFGKIVVASDADEFGKSICGLIINMFYRLWPELVEHGMLYRLVTPMVLVTGARNMEKEFFSLEDFEKWSKANQDKKFSYRFLKGLGSNNSKQFKKYLDNPDQYLVQFTLDSDQDRELLDLCFLKETGFTDKRKVWLNLEDDL
jgi:DNA topoisomerase-2